MQGPLIESLARQGVSRRTFLKYCATLASMMALPPAAGLAMAEAMAAARRPSVIWLPFQECTGCTESITRSHSPTLEGMIFDMISLDYQETLMAAAGHPAEEALHTAMKDNAGKYLLMALALLILYLRVLKPMLRKLSEAMARPPASHAQLQADAGMMALPGQRNYQENLSRAQKMANEDPRVVANIVKTWVGNNE